MEKLILEVNDVSRRFGELTVLRSVSLAVSKGEVVTITGPSGAGKSTLLHILGTLDRPSEGEVRVGGELVTQLNDARLSAFRNRHIGFVFQFHHLLPEFTSVENVSIPAFIAAKKPNKGLLNYWKNWVLVSDFIINPLNSRVVSNNGSRWPVP